MSRTAVRVEEIIIDNERDSFRASQALHDEFVIIPKGDLPAVEVHSDRIWVDDRFYGWLTNPNLLPDAKKSLLGYAACIDHLEARESAAAGELHARREELAQELSPLLNVTFSELSPAAKNAIDRIIELERKAS